MTIRTTTSIFLATALLCASATSLAASPKETVAAFHAALASGDKAKASSLLASEVTIYEAGHVERSRDEYAGHHLGGDIDFAKGVTRKILKQSERIDGKTAIVWEETESTGTARGKPVHAFGTETAVLEKTGDNWTIVHVHWSSRKAKGGVCGAAAISCSCAADPLSWWPSLSSVGNLGVGGVSILDVDYSHSLVSYVL